MMLKDFISLVEYFGVDLSKSIDLSGGSIYLCENIKEKPLVAKIIETHPDFEQGLISERFENPPEHYNLLEIVHYQLFHEKFNRHVIIMPYLEKGIWTPEKLNHEEKIEVLSQTLDAIQYLHHHGLIWQNLCEKHILLSHSMGQKIVKIINYGNKRQIPLEYFKDYSFLAPEQLEGHEIDSRTDIWAFGVLIYYIFTDVYPFGHPSLNCSNQKIKDRILNGHSLGLYGKIPSPYAQIARKCLQKSKKSRWTNCGEIIAVLLKQSSELIIESDIISNNFESDETKKTNVFNLYQIFLFIILAILLGLLIS